MIVYCVMFSCEDTHKIEGVFKTLQSAKNYILRQSAQRGLTPGSEIWIEKKQLLNNRCKPTMKQLLLEATNWEDNPEERERFVDKLLKDMKKVSCIKREI